MGYKPPEQLDADAEALLKEHQAGTLDDANYDLSEDEPEEGADPAPAEGDDAGEAGDPAKTDEEIAAEKVASDAAAAEGDDAGDAAGKPVTGTDKRVLDAQKKMHEATGKSSRLQKIADDVQAENDALRAQLKSGKTATVAATKVRLSKDRVAQLQKDYPDLADVFQDIHDTQVENVQLREDLNSGLKVVKAERSEDNFMSSIKSIHPDAETIQVSDEWTGWLKTQPSYIRRAIYEGATSDETAEIITNYKRDTGRPVPGETQSTEVVAEGGDESGEDPAPSDTPSKLEQARAAASPTLSKGARQRTPGAGKGKTYSKASIKAISEDPKKVQWLLSEEGEKYQQDVMLAMVQGRITD